MERRIEKEVMVAAPVSEVWEAWTTEEGVTSFFAPKANIDFVIGGRYEMLFDPDAPPGSRGGEGLKILGYTPQRMLSVDWNAPPHLPNVRRDRTRVVIQLEPQPQRKTRVKLTHLGWKKGEEWDHAFSYFIRAWDLVLARLAHRFTAGPIDWEDPYTPEAKELGSKE